MAYAPRTNATRLAQVRAVGAAYPLYGTITTRPSGQWERLHEGRYVLLDPGLMIGLDARVGDTISLGYQTFEIIGALDQVPGNPGIENAMAPRLFMSDRHMAGTGLLITGSRGDFDAYARYAGDPDALVKEKKAELDSAQVRARTIGQQETNITEGITELSNFLGLVGIIAILLGGVGVASGVNAWVMRKIETVASSAALCHDAQVMTIYVTRVDGLWVPERVRRHHPVPAPRRARRHAAGGRGGAARTAGHCDGPAAGALDRPCLRAAATHRPETGLTAPGAAPE
jgi:putative ABC transport system permease protein